MSASVFLDTLRKHDLDHFYPTFSTHGITQLQNLCQLSVQDYAALGITDITDRRKIFGLIQMLRKEAPPLKIMTSASTLTTTAATNTSGLRKPQAYPSMRTTSTTATSMYSNSSNDYPISPSNAYTSRLPQPPSSPAQDHTQRYSSKNNARLRRQSIISMQPSPSTTPKPERHVRSRTMSDAGHTGLPRASRNNNSNHSNRTDLRRSVLTTAPSSSKSSSDDEEDEDDTSARRYRASAPLLNAYGVPMSPSAMKARASMGALRFAASQSTALSSVSDLPPSDLNQKIRVCVRKRPLSRKDLERAEKDIINAIGTRSLQINEPKLKLDLTKYIDQHKFTFDDVFDADAKNTSIYERTALPLVRYIFQGGKATCFAYGQTGSGKTFTMLDPRHGLYVMAARDIFTALRTPENQHLSAWIGLYEIYQGQLYDLLNNRKKLFAREDGKQNVIISGLKEFPIDNVDKLVQIFAYGNQIRSTGSTGANDSSSRSHAVLQILLKPKKNRKLIHGKLSFIDLAGSERGADRGESDTKTRMEGAEINKSLLALKECIRALDQDKRHTPFRQSKLTQVLKDSFVGNSRTCMIATISPGGSNSEHTLNTLRYADRVKELKGERDRRAQLEKTNSRNGPDDAPWMIDTSTHHHSHNHHSNNHHHQISRTSSSTQDDGEDDDYYAFDDDDDDDDDVYSNDSDFLNDDDIDGENIFDVDFPHEQDAFINSSSTLPSTSASSLQQQQQQKPLQMGFSYNTTQQYQQQQQQQQQQQAAYYTRNPQQHPYPNLTEQLNRFSINEEQQQSPSPSALEDDLHFDRSQMEGMIKVHRAQIREVTECTKLETKLAGKMSTFLSNPDYDDDDITRSSQFRDYLRDLDEILELKAAAVEALRDRINDTVSDIQL
ncbi:P-loop containing nucleoside triphosphate hydrolase protein [Zychaea mexicana]|uniref:P-loop containing nucleoside triphosphate hydrolase protein n=1 Tax=Zychaea mexicana TaxID=64656 RepID=UPI0022FF4141|nr:P-loop containing nucleoside triphosphate hydrolase protein [Zychaea mexicana]KAI9482556.1 P-loop containing nucleoside triphosphate hydrolase protein [Zychaea mexicana]